MNIVEGKKIMNVKRRTREKVCRDKNILTKKVKGERMSTKERQRKKKETMDAGVFEEEE
jgi:hypothetical protein